MKLDLVRIGNSRGIRIPKPLIDQCGFGKSVEVSVESNRLVVSPAQIPREGWEDAIRAAIAKEGTAPLLLEGLPGNDFDHKEWQW